MKEEKISNKFLAVLAVLAIVITIVGVWNLIRVTKITGYATNVTSQTGIVSLSILGNLIMEIPDSELSISAELAQGENTNSEIINDFFEIQNGGSVNVDIKVYNGTELWNSVSSPTELWQIHCNSTTDAGATCNETYGALPATSGTAVTLIENLGNSAGSRGFKAGINVTVPELEDEGLKNGSVIFLCIQA